MQITISSMRKQQGITLAISLIFLLVLTIIGISAMSTSTLQEKMAGNMKDKVLSFQAAESAMTSAENWMQLQTTTVRGQTTDNVLSPSVDGIPVWRTANRWSGANSIEHPNTPDDLSMSDVFDLRYLSDSPRYIVEDMGALPCESKTTDCGGYGGAPQRYMYRITARGQGGTNNAVTMLQSTFAWY